MTRDEHRAQCIEAMAINYILEFKNLWPGSRPTKVIALQFMTAAFDSLHGIAYIDPIDATEEMRAAAYEEEQREGITTGSALILWRVMAARGNLTNPPEPKT